MKTLDEKRAIPSGPTTWWLTAGAKPCWKRLEFIEEVIRFVTGLD